MTIKLYTGRMGSGKTYEVVSEVILGAVRRGRRVVSNIAGLDVAAMHELLIAEGVPEDKLGSVVMFSHDEVMKPNFWRTDSSGGSEPDSFIQPGDLLALDEIWRFWSGLGKTDGEGRKRPPSVMNFFRMHRHFIHEQTGVACDVALITQDLMDLSRDVRSVVEETYYMEKLTAVGSTKRYRVDIYQAGRIRGKPLRSIQRSYDPKYFPLYSSHSQKKEGGADAVEENIDKRGNILSGWFFKILLPLLIPVFALSVWGVWSFLHPAEKPKQTETAAASAETKNNQVKEPGPAKAPDQPPITDRWRVVGWYETGGAVRVTLSDGSQTRYLVAPDKLKIAGSSIEVGLPEGGFATSWTGNRPTRAGLPGLSQ